MQRGEALLRIRYGNFFVDTRPLFCIFYIYNFEVGLTPSFQLSFEGVLQAEHVNWVP